MRAIIFGATTALLLFAQAARADIVSPQTESCTDQDAGTACTTEPTNENGSGGGQAGICTAAACFEGHVISDDAGGVATTDSGSGDQFYGCTYCKVLDAGTGVSANDSGVITVPYDGGTTTTTTSGSSTSGGGCSIGAIGAGDIASGFGILGVLLPFAVRRRRK